MDYPRHDESYEDTPVTEKVPDHFDPKMLLDFDLARLIEMTRYLDSLEPLAGWENYGETQAVRENEEPPVGTWEG